MIVPAQARFVGVDRAEAAARRLVAAGVVVWRSPTQRRVALALAVAVLGAVSFAHIAEDYLTNDPLARWDVTFARWLFGERETDLLDAFRVVTLLGSPATGVAAVAIVSVVLFRRRLLPEAALLPLVLVGAQLLDLVLKLSFHRPRPEVAFVHLDTYSFPSGHAMTATAVYGALAYLLAGRLPTPGRRIVLFVGTAALVGVICFSRLYLGVHYLSDVLAGVAAGIAWLGLAIASYALYGERLATRVVDSRVDRIARHITRS